MYVEATLPRRFVPRTGLVYSEKTNLSEARRALPREPARRPSPPQVLCKPKIMPIRPQHLVRKEQAELDAEGEDDDDAEAKP